MHLFDLLVARAIHDHLYTFGSVPRPLTIFMYQSMHPPYPCCPKLFIEPAFKLCRATSRRAHCRRPAWQAFFKEQRCRVPSRGKTRRLHRWRELSAQVGQQPEDGTWRL
jgi:hypothetical protein